MYPIPMAVMMMVLRWGVEKFMFRPIGQQVGMKDSRKPYPKINSVLEAEFRKNKNLSPAVTEELSRKSSLTQLEVRFLMLGLSSLSYFRSRDGSDKEKWRSCHPR